MSIQTHWHNILLMIAGTSIGSIISMSVRYGIPRTLEQYLQFHVLIVFVAMSYFIKDLAWFNGVLVIVGVDIVTTIALMYLNKGFHMICCVILLSGVLLAYTTLTNVEQRPELTAFAIIFTLVTITFYSLRLIFSQNISSPINRKNNQCGI